ncbi:transmembrane protein 62-like [Saccostrea echinata]|uniref:transmembrane protein 62-like n=1 Tax=Saccostrea echinata TaxID=191078 RepID=UPI002A82B1B0|nr:transmembrane protein 62-like [Saccostrea echinata]
MKLFAVSLMFIASFCIFIGFIENIVNTEHVDNTPNPREINHIHFNEDDLNLWWFVQLTDIHVSKFKDPKRPEDLIKFCRHHLPRIAPELIIVTGDLTDAKYRNERGSAQFIEEWKGYGEVVTLCQKYNNDVKWLDLRGNHDAFNVPDMDDRKNLFRTYSEQGGVNPTSYLYTHKTKFGDYSFIAMDATPDPGPRRPFNFCGSLREKEIKLLKKLSKDSKNSNMTFWFGHYPTSFIVTADNSDVRQLMRNASVYFCGHLHTWAGLIPDMYTRHRTGMYELELADWKDNRVYRVVAIDNNVMAFSDQVFHEEPVVIFTNPQHAKFPSPHKVTSSHIRLLVFSPSEDLSVTVYIDNQKIGIAKKVRGPLYVLPWKPELFKNGQHHIKAVVKEKDFVIQEKTQPFSLDGTIEPFPLRARLILMLNFPLLGKCLFYFLVIVYCVVLCLLRRCTDIRSIQLEGRMMPARFIRNFINLWIFRIWLVSKTTRIFLILISFTIYLAVGPWFVAEVVDGHTGILFVWGLYVKGAILPDFLTYLYGIFQMVTFNIPLLFHVGYVLGYPQSFSEASRLRFSHRLRHLYIPMIALILFQSYMTLVEFPYAYGTKAMILGPVRTGSIFVGLYCYYLARSHHSKSALHSS